jgi:DNA-binding HxlR family transcriptional regulator
MRLAFDTPNPSEIRPRDIMHYGTFRRRFGKNEGEGESELDLAERFHAARILFERGNDHVYIEVPLRTEGPSSGSSTKITADVCGVTNEDLTLVFCVTSAPDEELFEKLRVVEDASNARAVVLYPFSASPLHLPRIRTEYRKLDVARVPWLDEQIDNTFREVIQMVEMFANQTRVRMLTPLLEKGFKKRDYRRVINPKLLYENLATLLESGIINEAEDESYRLTQFGSDLFGEYLAFLERVRRVIERETDESRGGES